MALVSESEDFFANFFVAPSVSLQPLPPDPDDVQVRNPADLQLK